MAFLTSMYRCAFAAILLATSTISEAPPKQPNIIVIIGDDIGNYDLSFHGCNQIPTPNIDALAMYGIGLNNYYVQPLCSPSRASFLTGKYPINLGFQNGVVVPTQPWGLGLDEKLMPEYLKEVGYETHAIGKWHIGCHRRAYTPLYRGFDSHLGYLGAYIDYWNHSTASGADDGRDMRYNLETDWDVNGTYATDLFSDRAVNIIENHDTSKPLFLYLAHLAGHAANPTDPLQAPEELIEKFGYISDANRQIYAAMLTALDHGVGRVVQALAHKHMLENSVILFFTDNGGPTTGSHSNTASNYPFRGIKNTPWMGGVRSGGAIWSPYLKKRQRASNQLIHISDWLPTFGHIAGFSVDRPIDGCNVWLALSHGTESPRNEVMINVDDKTPYISYVQNNWKIMNGTTSGGQYDQFLGDITDQEVHPSLINYDEAILESEAGRCLRPFSFNQQPGVGHVMSGGDILSLRESYRLNCNGQSIPADELLQCNPLTGPCLFNLVEDPCEMINLASIYPDKLAALFDRIDQFRCASLAPLTAATDSRCSPKYYNYTWTWYLDVIDENKLLSLFSLTHTNLAHMQELPASTVIGDVSVPHGPVLGAILFEIALGTNILLKGHAFVYHDDILIFYDTEDPLLSDLNIDLKSFTQLFKGQRGKFKLFEKAELFSKKDTLEIKFVNDATLNDQTIEFLYLGFYLADTPNWENHLSTLKNKLLWAPEVSAAIDEVIPVRLQRSFYNTLSSGSPSQRTETITLVES